MRKKVCLNLVYISFIAILLSSCGSKDDETNKVIITDVPYVDMSSFKGDGGYIIENNVYDYTEVFDKVYDWGDGIKMPFFKPEGINGKILNGSYGFENVTDEGFDQYIQELASQGFNTSVMDSTYSRLGLIHNDKMLAALCFEKDRAGELGVYVFTGFVKEPILKSETVKKLIDDNKLLEGKSNFENYFIIPIENETVRKEGLYECLVFTEKYYEEFADDCKPYYMITDGENVCLFQQSVYNPYAPSSANIIETDGEKQLILTAGWYADKGLSGEKSNCTGVFIYEFSDNKFVETGEKLLSMKDGADEYIGKSTDEGFKLYKMKCLSDWDGSQGRKSAYKIIEAYAEDSSNVDMSEYKGQAGYVIENNVYNYTGVFETLYQWENDVNMPFPKPEGAEGGIENGTYVFQGITNEEFELYMEVLAQQGFNTSVINRNSEKYGLIHNQGMMASLCFDKEAEGRLAVNVITGFVKKPIYLFEQAVYSPYYPSSANLVEKNGKKQLVLTSGLYFFNPYKSSAEDNSTGVFTYELNEKKFVKKEEKKLPSLTDIDLYIGKSVDDEIKMYHMTFQYEYTEKNGRKSLWIIDGEYEEWNNK